MDLPVEVPYEIALIGQETEALTVEEFANFLRDLVFLHDRLWILASGNRTKNYDLSAGYFYTRNARPVPEDQRLVLTHARKESPFDIGILITSAAEVGAVAWLYVQIIRGVLLLPGEIEKQDLEIQKLRQATGAEDVSGRHGPSNLDEDLGALPGMEGRDADTVLHLVHRDIERIKESRLRIIEARIIRMIKRSR